MIEPSDSFPLQPTPFTRPKGETAVLDEWLARLTIGHGVLWLILLVTAVSRFTNLAAAPLSPSEAETAWGVWQSWQPNTTDFPIPSPAYFTLTGLLSQLVGFNDATMRLIPALFGLGIVYLPWLLRSRLGNTGALMTSLLLAFSPLQTIVARTAGGDSLVLFATLLLLIAFVRYQETEESRWFITLGVALALGLTSSPLFYGVLLTFLLAWVTQRFLGPPLFSRKLFWGQFEDRTVTAVVTITLFILLSTLTLLHLWGFGAAVSLPVSWLGQFGAGVAGMKSPLDAFLALGRYEPALVLLGLAAIVWVAFNDEALANFAVYWLVAVFILILLQPGQMNLAALATLPVTLMIGLLAQAVLKAPVERPAWVLAAGVFLVEMAIWLHIGRFLRLVVYDSQNLGNLWVAFLLFTLSLSGVYFATSWNWRAASQGVLLGVLLFCLYFQWGTGWWLAQHASNDPRERWVTTGTADNVPIATEILTEISQQVTASRQELEILSIVDSPVLRWYLRHFKRVQFAETLPSPVQSAVVISPATETDLTLGSDYVGTDFVLTQAGLQTQETTTLAWLDTLRWWFFQETTAVPIKTQAIIWLRADLAQQP